MMRGMLEKARQLGQLRAIDLHAGLFAGRLAGQDAPELSLAAALVSRAVGEGHICLPLIEAAESEPFGPELPCVTPTLPAWRDLLLGSGLVGRPGGGQPLILDSSDRLYLARYHADETLIGKDLLRRSRTVPLPDMVKAASLLQQLFAGRQEDAGQKLAAAAALLRRFVVISGGPGTGKTYTVARILALLQAMHDSPLRIGLTAPTGRAAVRLHESISKARQSMAAGFAATVPDTTQTIHRLLGLVPTTGRFRHDRSNRLHLDLLVVDEASMVDVPLMAALVTALPDEARLILLGDRDQLTSVEAGSLFGDICGRERPVWSAGFCSQLRELTGTEPEAAKDGGKGSFVDSVVLLERGFRFEARSGIAQIAAAVNRAAGSDLARVLAGSYPDLTHVAPAMGAAGDWLRDQLWQHLEPCFAAPGPGEALTLLGRFRVLCALREGPTGVAGINNLAEELLRSKGLVVRGEQWYRGRPVMIRRNHYGLQLFNGDTGIIWPDETGSLQAWFSRPDGELEPIALAQLPQHETAYATTIHKAQGSEFDTVLMVLPGEDNRVLSRELVYTGITRARHRLIILDPAALLSVAASRRVIRHSGLGDILRQQREPCGL